MTTGKGLKSYKSKMAANKTKSSKTGVKLKKCERIKEYNFKTIRIQAKIAVPFRPFCWADTFLLKKKSTSCPYFEGLLRSGLKQVENSSEESSVPCVFSHSPFLISPWDCP